MEAARAFECAVRAFARGNDVRCRFGDRESTAEWHSENFVSCASPALPPEMEVQSVAVVSRQHISRKCNRLKLQQPICRGKCILLICIRSMGLRPSPKSKGWSWNTIAQVKAEIQDVEIRAHAAQGPALVELKVDTEADEGQVQQRLSVRAPFRREVQRLIMAPLLGDNRALSEDAHYEVQQLDLTGTGNFTLTLNGRTTRPHDR